MFEYSDEFAILVKLADFEVETAILKLNFRNALPMSQLILETGKKRVNVRLKIVSTSSLYVYYTAKETTRQNTSLLNFVGTTVREDEKTGRTANLPIETPFVPMSLLFVLQCE